MAYLKELKVTLAEILAAGNEVLGPQVACTRA